MYNGASQNASHLILSITSGVSAIPSFSSGSVCCCVARRSPVTIRNSGVTFDASVVHCPPFFRIASSLIVGVPDSIDSRSRSSWLLSPSHPTVRVPSATAAVSPAVAL